MVVDLDIEDVLDGLLDHLDARVAELDDFARVGHDDVIVLLVEIRFLVMRLVLPELVLADKRAIQQQLDRVVKRGAAYTIVFVLHLEVQVLDVEMLFALVNFLQDGISLGRFAVAVVLEVKRENVLYDLLVFAVVDGNKCHAANVVF